MIVSSLQSISALRRDAMSSPAKVRLLLLCKAGSCTWACALPPLALTASAVLAWREPTAQAKRPPCERPCRYHKRHVCRSSFFSHLSVPSGTRVSRNLEPCLMHKFQVVWRGGLWHVHIPHAGRGVHGSEEKSCIVDWAHDEARRVQGEVHVLDRGGRVEIIYTYVDGVEACRTPSPRR